MTDADSPSVSPAARDHEAMAVADVALALAGHEAANHTRQLELRIARGEIAADEAVADIIARYTTGHSGYSAPA